MIVGVVIAGVVGLAVGAFAAALREKRDGTARLEAARAQAKAIVQRGRREAHSLKAKHETEARAAAFERRSAADEELRQRDEKLNRRSEDVTATSAKVEDYLAGVAERDRELGGRKKRIQSQRNRVKSLRRDVEERRAELRELLETRAGLQGTVLIDGLTRRWLEEAEAGAAHRLRAIEQSTADSSWSREAERILNIAASRYQNHFLTERLISNVKITPEVAETLTREEGRIRTSIEAVANVTLNLAETGESVRLEGLDGIGREVARRALSKLSKKAKVIEAAAADPSAWATGIREQLEREIVGLGRKAFQVLGVKRAHPEIVDLVGRLNWRTSYTQNQWLHAVEASFLAGMMASELRLDVKLARRATLMHDIGKALTHQIEGSHAVIGADIARRLGEDEVVANAIGAHHLDEPMGSVYAHLVAAADAMSGARPGARREHEGGYNTKLEDLERIGHSYKSVAQCHAVHGGRELRVYVDEEAVSDLEAVELSQQIAERVSDEMVFPGQIKVTVIRATEAVSVAN